MDIPRRDHAKSYRERQIHDFIYVWNLKKKKRTHRNRRNWLLSWVEHRQGGMEKMVKMVRGFKLPFVRWISSGDVSHSIMTIINSILST